MRTHARIEIEPFKPHNLMKNGHTQTVMGSMLRTPTGVRFRRERLFTPDGDFLDIDFADVSGASWEDLGETKPIVLFLHGLEGNARSGPAHEIYRYLSRRGVRCVGMNMRSCSGELNWTGTMYHAGFTDDLALVHDMLEKRYPNVPKGIVAISMGANILLKYLGEGGHPHVHKLVAAVAISPPFDMVAGSHILSRGVGLRYTQRMLNPLKEKVKGLRDVLPPEIDIDALDGYNDFRAFDHNITAQMYGFDGVDDYYRRSSSQNFLEDIDVPTLVLRAV
ncbi:MAG: alpha/beta fold hydrolase, partial [Chloroflexota bacterium]